jgi:hypothetical protein
MKKFVNFMILFSALSLLSFECEEKTPAETITDGCIDPAKIKKDAACIMVFDPVCGCDNKTYGNSCVAINAGVLTFTAGSCN